MGSTGGGAAGGWPAGHAPYWGRKGVRDVARWGEGLKASWGGAGWGEGQLGVVGQPPHRQSGWNRPISGEAGWEEGPLEVGKLPPFAPLPRSASSLAAVGMIATGRSSHYGVLVTSFLDDR